MFGSRKRKERQRSRRFALELSAAELRSRAVVADALAKMELRLSRDVEQRRQLQSVTESAVETLQSSVTNSSTEIARALGQVANMCAIVAETTRRRPTRAPGVHRSDSRRAAVPPAPKVDGPSQIIGGNILRDVGGSRSRTRSRSSTPTAMLPADAPPHRRANLDRRHAASRDDRIVDHERHAIHQEVGDPRA